MHHPQRPVARRGSTGTVNRRRAIRVALDQGRVPEAGGAQRAPTTDAALSDGMHPLILA